MYPFKNESSTHVYARRKYSRRSARRQSSALGVEKSFSRRQRLLLSFLVNFDIVKRRWIPSGLSQAPPFLSLLPRSTSYPLPLACLRPSLYHTLTLRSLRPLVSPRLLMVPPASLVSSIQPRSNATWGNGGGGGGGREEEETVVLSRPEDDLFPLCPRARTNSRCRDARQRGLRCRLVCALSDSHSRQVLSLRAMRAAIRKATLISSDGARR